MAGFVVIAAMSIGGTIGAAVGLLLGWIGEWRRERWAALRIFAMVANTAVLAYVVSAYFQQ